MEICNFLGSHMIFITHAIAVGLILRCISLITAEFAPVGSNRIKANIFQSSFLNLIAFSLVGISYESINQSTQWNHRGALWIGVLIIKVHMVICTVLNISWDSDVPITAGSNFLTSGATVFFSWGIIRPSIRDAIFFFLSQVYFSFHFHFFGWLLSPELSNMFQKGSFISRVLEVFLSNSMVLFIFIFVFCFTEFGYILLNFFGIAQWIWKFSISWFLFLWNYRDEIQCITLHIFSISFISLFQVFIYKIITSTQT